jgi:hypothetical protein
MAVRDGTLATRLAVMIIDVVCRLLSSLVVTIVGILASDVAALFAFFTYLWSIHDLLHWLTCETENLATPCDDEMPDETTVQVDEASQVKESVQEAGRDVQIPDETTAHVDEAPQVDESQQEAICDDEIPDVTTVHVDEASL